MINVVLAHFLQTEGKNIYAMDALFGLPRKKSAGVSYRDPLHCDLLFCNQSEVDEFVAESVSSKRAPNVSGIKFNVLCAHSHTLFLGLQRFSCWKHAEKC